MSDKIKTEKKKNKMKQGLKDLATAAVILAIPLAAKRLFGNKK
ncbi:MAG: hypothetical protein ACI3Z9_08775 [Candidatus Onthomorpha sp.]